MWLDSVVNAISQVDSQNPGLAEKVANFDSDSMSESDWEEYNKVAGAIVEPFAFPDNESDDEDFYYDMTDNSGYASVKANLPGIDNKDTWLKIIDLVEELGY